MTKPTPFPNSLYNIDARKLNGILTDKVIDVTITSPPYFDLKDYGYKNQIGYGQKYEDYLEDIKIVFKSVYECTKESGTLWVIIDVYREKGEIVPLPFDFSNKIREIGWKLREIIVWVKDKTVPWTHKGQMRNLFEYILVFSKSEQYNFYVDEVRDYVGLKKWWVKYPERYNPKGKIPSGVWHFNIPVQGSWGDGYIKHFCPLPEEMISQILKISSKEGDLVLDPFAGSGAVLSKADSMNRRYIGFELNPKYVEMFANREKNKEKLRACEKDRSDNIVINRDKFKILVTDLRALKYARVLYKKAKQAGISQILKIYVNKNELLTAKKHTIISVNYHFLLLPINDPELKKLKDTLIVLSKATPLSKFGISSNFTFLTSTKEFMSLMDGKDNFTYTEKTTHRFKEKFNSTKVFLDSETIISDIMVNLNEKDYE